MRIISNFKDYYDCIQSYGQDDDLVYLRKTEEKIVAGSITQGYYIGFCGKIYPVLIRGYIIPYTYIYSIEEMDKYMATKNKSEQDTYYGRKKRYYWYNRETRVSLDDFLNFRVPRHYRDSDPAKLDPPKYYGQFFENYNT